MRNMPLRHPRPRRHGNIDKTKMVNVKARMDGQAERQGTIKRYNRTTAAVGGFHTGTHADIFNVFLSTSLPKTPAPTQPTDARTSSCETRKTCSHDAETHTTITPAHPPGGVRRASRGQGGPDDRRADGQGPGARGARSAALAAPQGLLGVQDCRRGRRAHVLRHVRAAPGRPLAARLRAVN